MPPADFHIAPALDIAARINFALCRPEKRRTSADARSPESTLPPLAHLLLLRRIHARMTLRQLLFQRFEGDTFRFRDVAQDIEVAGSANNTIQQEASCRAQTGIKQRESIG